MACVWYTSLVNLFQGEGCGFLSITRDGGAKPMQCSHAQPMQLCVRQLR